MSWFLLADEDGHRSQDIALPKVMATQIMRSPGLAANWVAPQGKTCFGVFVAFLLYRVSKFVIFHIIGMKDKVAKLTATRKRLLQQMPDLATVLPGSLWSRMVRCNNPGCRFCEKGKGKGHGPIWILSVCLGNRQVRQVPIPGELKEEVEESLRAFAQTQSLLKQIAQVNLELLKERKRQRS